MKQNACFGKFGQLGYGKDKMLVTIGLLRSQKYRTVYGFYSCYSEVIFMQIKN